MYKSNYYYEIDGNYIREIQRQQHHNNQMVKSIECINKLDELKRSLNDLDEEYRNHVMAVCFGMCFR